MNLKLALQLVRNMGFRYSIYRLKHEAEKKIGLLKKRHPSDLVFKGISLDDWRKNKSKFVIDSKQNLSFKKNKSEILKEKTNRIIQGELQFFNNEWIKIGSNYDWLTNPSNGYKYDINKHWSEIPDLSDEAGDIKYVWEKSRFTYLLNIIKFDYNFELDLSEFVFSEIDSWIDANPINMGPNWRCSQEISLRIFNWCYALYYYQDSAFLTQDRWNRIQLIIYSSLHHVYNHISFSRIAVRNNHAITETLFLALSNILFPFIPETKKWSEDGFRWFEEEINYQIYSDGTFLQFSMNYHRVVIQLLTLAISIYELNNLSLSKLVMDRAYKSLNFLYQCMQDENGNLPNYGSNDGALFFPLTQMDYRDYRPQLNTLHFILTGTVLFDELEIKEDLFWFGQNSIVDKFAPIKKLFGCQSFEIGGYYLCRSNGFFTFIRCGNHRDRPAQADNLHLDIWYKGENILRDSGSYKYNTDKEKINYFMGTLSHNTVMVEDQSQMLKGGRFIWYFWTQCLEARWSENNEAYIFKGKIKAFNHISSHGIHEREIVISKTDPSWEVKDIVYGLDGKLKKQIWHPNSKLLSINNDENFLQTFPSYNSNYYGSYTDENSIYFEFKNQISTNIQYKLK